MRRTHHFNHTGNYIFETDRMKMQILDKKTFFLVLTSAVHELKNSSTDIMDADILNIWYYTFLKLKLGF